MSDATIYSSVTALKNSSQFVDVKTMEINNTCSGQSKLCYL
jgi:hypothetical protein